MTDLLLIGQRAKSASRKLAALSSDEKNAVLLSAADALLIDENVQKILEGNAKDLDNAVKSGMSDGLKDRLRLTKERLQDMAQALRDIAALPDPVGEVLETIERPNGLRLLKTSAPIGVIGIIYEARPNVTSDAWSLCFKTSNAVILKGGSDAIHSNIAITEVIRSAMASGGVDPDGLMLIEATDHETTNRFMQMNDYVDVLIPRGSQRLIQAVVKNASVPVIETGAGNCHIYIEKTGDIDKAVPIVYNAKTQRIGVCNACESLVIDRDALEKLVPVVKKLQEKDVITYADEASFEVLKKASGTEGAGLRMELVNKATEEDFATEYLDYKISVKTVDSTDEAIEHINLNSTHHSEAIITEDAAKAEKFLNGIDSACVYWNASTRFTDGGCFGFGAEIGISTSKLHARGPMGLRELTTYKYKIYGNGQTR
ncbi:glutamate-5-semialdehyde dehydrogenase [Oribacterium sp. WCC10]|uniref:glutamate-5-semialdehyde dehydrogenase n=1 Tax=Oribacterium sp. WCC10 TaxID=1855343 RepID=UPI0008DF0ECD|nr:glutamate-5-semialdehyde dehydrogenase [Oribacterium sp. WCC10]SFG08110.1 glutamate-5-semialdehyde dehydrogenase [Oribacterium sp. WCC10]